MEVAVVAIRCRSVRKYFVGSVRLDFVIFPALIQTFPVAWHKRTVDRGQPYTSEELLAQEVEKEEDEEVKEEEEEEEERKLDLDPFKLGEADGVIDQVSIISILFVFRC